MDSLISICLFLVVDFDFLKIYALVLGQWWHAGFHLTTAIVGPTILTLPYAFRGLGWGLGFLCLTLMGVVTFYSYYLMSKVLDHCEKAGRRHIRFRELAADVLGNKSPKLTPTCTVRFASLVLLLLKTKRFLLFFPRYQKKEKKTFRFARSFYCALYSATFGEPPEATVEWHDRYSRLSEFVKASL